MSRALVPLRAPRRLALIATAVVLVAFALGDRGPAGRTTEQPRSPLAAPRASNDPGRAQAEKAGVDIDAVVDKVRHRVAPAEDGSGALAAHDAHYRARFDAGGFGFALGDHPSGLDVSLRVVERGDRELAVSPRAWTGEANVAERGLGSGMTERVTARAGELEWDVVLAHPLPGTGELRLEAELRGLDGVPARMTRPPAWRFPLGDGRAARMGEVVIKDAAGAALHRSLPQVRAGKLRLVVPASVLASARYPLTIDPTVGPEVAIGTPVHGAADDFQQTSAVASNGSDFLVVWEDRRIGDLTDYDIFATRVSGDGTVLDPTGILVSAGPGINERGPAVASNGTDYFVVWHDFRSGVNHDIYGTRVTAAGDVLSPSGTPVSTAVNSQSSPALAWNGTHFLVAWLDFRTNPGIDIYGTRVTAAGGVLNPSGIPISTATNNQARPAVASNGSDFLVVWEDQRTEFLGDIYGARVSAAGSVLDPAGIPVGTAADAQRAAAVAANGTDYLVAWEHDPSPSHDRDIKGARVSSAGVVLDPAGIVIAAAANSQVEPAIAWNGARLLVVYDSEQDVYGTRLDGAGNVLDPAGFLIESTAHPERMPAVAWNGTAFLASWDRVGGAQVDVYGARVNGAGTVLDPPGFILSTSANDQRAPAVAWNGTEFLVVWDDRRSRDGTAFLNPFAADIYGTRVSGSGVVLDPAGIAISTAASDQSTPAVTWNGTHFLVVWRDIRSGSASDYDIYGTRVSTAGSVLDPAGIPISTADDDQVEPALAWSGTHFLVVWSNRFGYADIYGARVSAAGVVLDPAGIPVGTGASFSSQATPAVAWNGTNFLVVWQDSPSGGTPDVYGARVSGGGSVLDPSGIAISTAANDQTAPAVASWGDRFFVVWQDRRSGTTTDIYGAGVSGAGVVRQPAGTPISTASGNQEAPDLAVRYDFLVVWRDRRAGNYDIYGTRVSPAGVVDQPAGLPVSVSPLDEAAPAVSGGPGATWMVPYQRFAPEPPYGAHRVFLRSVTPK